MSPHIYLAVTQRIKLPSVQIVSLSSKDTFNGFPRWAGAWFSPFLYQLQAHLNITVELNSCRALLG